MFIACDLDAGSIDANCDFADVKGHKNARCVAEIAAGAGSHNIIMSGPSGSGKTMIVKRIPGILPPMTFDEAVEATRIWSVSRVVSLRAA